MNITSVPHQWGYDIPIGGYGIPIGGGHSLYSCFLVDVLIEGAKSVLMKFDFVFNVLFLVLLAFYLLTVYG